MRPLASINKGLVRVQGLFLAKLHGILITTQLEFRLQTTFYTLKVELSYARVYYTKLGVDNNG
jgi:hypothetical protein